MKITIRLGSYKQNKPTTFKVDTCVPIQKRIDECKGVNYSNNTEFLFGL